MNHLSEGEIIKSLKWNYLAIPLLVFSLAASKISICLMLLRILHKTNTKFKRSFLYGTIVLLTIIAIPTAAYALGRCQPVKKLWNFSTPGHCQHLKIYRKLSYVHGGQEIDLWICFWKLTKPAINALCDFALAIFPISFLKKLQLQLHKKIVLSLLMCCGIVYVSMKLKKTFLIVLWVVWSTIGVAFLRLQEQYLRAIWRLKVTLHVRKPVIKIYTSSSSLTLTQKQTTPLIAASLQRGCTFMNKRTYTDQCSKHRSNRLDYCLVCPNPRTHNSVPKK